MRLVVLQAGAMVADVVCGEEAVYVGSDAECRVRLEHPQVAPQQAVIFPKGDGRWAVQPLAGGCGLLVNRARLAKEATLKAGDEITIADYAIRVYPDYEEQPTARVEVGTSRAQLERFVASKLPPGTLIKRPDEPLGIQQGQLFRIGEANLAVSQCVQIEDLMNAALRTLLVAFAAQRVWMGVRRVNYGPMEYVEGRLLTGKSSDLPEVANLLKPRVLDRGQFLLVPLLGAAEQMSVLAGPLVGPEGTLGMLYMDTGESGRRFNVRDLDFFMLLATVFAVQLDAIYKHIARNRGAMVAGEVAVAHAIQARLTPRKLPQWEQVQFGAFREPGRENTGDIYDVVKLANGMAAFMVAHTPATGPMPSMLMSTAQAAFRSGAMHQDPPHVFLKSLNRLLWDGEKDHPLNCCVGIIDPATGEMRYSMAGEPRAYMIGNRGEARWLGPRESAASLGQAKNTAYPLLPEQLQPAETLVLFTPGVTTAKSRNDETFGEDRFVSILCDGFGQLASAMLKEMLTDLRNFTEGGSQPDDITVLLAHHVDQT